jgi:hypothetical protein
MAFFSLKALYPSASPPIAADVGGVLADLTGMRDTIGLRQRELLQ